MTKKRVVALGAGGVVGLLGVYLLVWPVAIDPVAWHPGKNPGYTGAFAGNKELAKAKVLAAGELGGAEAIAVGVDGTMYTGLADGRIVRVSEDGAKVETIAKTGGRPLGVELSADGTKLIVADASKGLLEVGMDGTVTVLASELDGKAFKFADDVAIARDGTIYFSDASMRFGLKDFKNEVMEHRDSGRVIAYHPDTKTLEVVASGLAFANGVALAGDESFLAVAETSSYRVRRVWLTADKRGQMDVLLDNLPGFPDNVTWAPIRRVFWVALGSPRDGALDALADKPFLRKVVARLPEAVQPKAKKHAVALGVDANGVVLYNLQDSGAGSYGPIASVIEAYGKLYLGTYSGHGVAVTFAPPLPDDRVRDPGRHDLPESQGAAAVPDAGAK